MHYISCCREYAFHRIRSAMNKGHKSEIPFYFFFTCIYIESESLYFFEKYFILNIQYWLLDLEIEKPVIETRKILIRTLWADIHEVVTIITHWIINEQDGQVKPEDIRNHRTCPGSFKDDAAVICDYRVAWWILKEVCPSSLSHPEASSTSLTDKTPHASQLSGSYRNRFISENLHDPTSETPRFLKEHTAGQ